MRRIIVYYRSSLCNQTAVMMQDPVNEPYHTQQSSSKAWE
jgi:hypothetical protein